ncbi:hypothetical protein BT93_B1919 [Corymbia citriodora subsp. variegata]|nr:hypothetical protein BT93_B1919 [Corymbia citriodora subsp. variegata]KAF8039548.1 hypothetical protein BT93_B1919 [Corymbia citriodora subsp. variegata]KAF8039549.1 hypothetical protein BT93_B1919 [Corymbia citriodora subsp. variegata]
MAEHLASIFGTEKDRVNCPFYFKIGACRHGDRCSRLHTKPSISPTLLLSNMYQRPDMITPGVDAQGQPIDPRQIQQHFEDFYEDLFEELNKYGEIESLNICDNLADHMVGNVYVQFRGEEQAERALKSLSGRYYAGRPIIVDYSPVTDFREATCRQYEEDKCNRGGYCNFMHLKSISRELRRQLFGRYLGGIDGGIVGAGAGAPIGTVATKSTLMEEGDMGGDMMSMTIMIAGAGGTGPLVLTIGEVGAHEEGGMPVQLGKVVRRGVPELNNGTGKGNSKKMLT